MPTEVMGAFQPDPPWYDVAFLEWLRYYVWTEAFDRKLPGAFIRPDEWLPSPEFRHISNGNAAKLTRETIAALAGKVPRDVSESARKRALEMPFATATYLLKELEASCPQK